MLDCQWIQQLHTFGLRPDDQICVLRSYLRQRAMLVTYASHHIQHVQKAREQMNVKLTSKSALGAFFRRLKARLGAPKAITATAHKLARLFYRMIKFGSEYVDQGQEYYDRRYRTRVVSNLTRRAQELGYTLLKTPEPSPAPTEA